MERLIELGEKMNLEGEKLHEFVHEQQAIEREERATERGERAKAIEREERATEREEREREREMRRLQLETEERSAKEELEFRKLELERKSSTKETTGDAEMKPEVVAKAKLPKLLPFQDGKDDLDSYLQWFERYARTSGWAEDQWAPALSTLLTGKALEAYSRMSDAVATDYGQLREALFRRYDLTEDGYRLRFRRSRPEPGESPEQFIHRLRSYLGKWMTMSRTMNTAVSVKDLFI